MEKLVYTQFLSLSCFPVGNMKDSKTKDEESTLLTYTELCHS